MEEKRTNKVVVWIVEKEIFQDHQRNEIINDDKLDD